MNNNAIAIAPIIPSDYQTCLRMAEIMCKSGLMPKNIDSPDKVFVAMQMGAGLGLTPMQSVQSIAVVNGKPALYGDAMLAIIKASGLLESMKEEITGDDKNMVAKCIVKRKGEAEPTTGEWSVNDATKAGKWGAQGPWTQYPKRMLQMRARSFALRDAFPDLLLGLQHTVEELRDGGLIDVTPPEPKPPKSAPIVSPPEPAEDMVYMFYEQNGSAKTFTDPKEAFDHVHHTIDGIRSREEYDDYNVWSKANVATIQLLAPQGSLDRKFLMHRWLLQRDHWAPETKSQSKAA